MKPSSALGYRLGALIGAVLLAALLLPSGESMRSLGPPNTGHSALQCTACHHPAPGTTRQQLQANVRYWIGLRNAPVDFHHARVTNSACEACHANPKDNHPAFRFNEPRFADARAAIAPQECVSCHREHTGVRVTQTTDFCVHCHADLALKNDPIDIPHSRLIADANWASCLSCHDFHGNHDMTLRTTVSAGISSAAIAHYFQGGPSPYSPRKFFAAISQEPSR